ncbi:MAG: hypothetical protein JNK58_08685 [Phycisphaerae bacterium]|nr:hypothetical protein [Phycisphaerae bacterium]
MLDELPAVRRAGVDPDDRLSKPEGFVKLFLGASSAVEALAVPHHDEQIGLVDDDAAAGAVCDPFVRTVAVELKRSQPTALPCSTQYGTESFERTGLKRTIFREIILVLLPEERHRAAQRVIEIERSFGEDPIRTLGQRRHGPQVRRTVAEATGVLVVERLRGLGHRGQHLADRKRQQWNIREGKPVGTMPDHPDTVRQGRPRRPVSPR